MSNMSYCRFENTSHDLADCLENWHETNELSDYEIQGRQRLIQQALELIDIARSEEEFEDLFPND